MVAAENGGWVGHMGEVAPSRAFFKFFFVPSMRPQLTLRSVDFRSVHPKTCFGGVCVPLGSICPEGQIFPFLPPKPFFNGPNKTIILHVSE